MQLRIVTTWQDFYTTIFAGPQFAIDKVLSAFGFYASGIIYDQCIVHRTIVYATSFVLWILSVP